MRIDDPGIEAQWRAIRRQLRDVSSGTASARLIKAVLVAVSKREFNTPIREPWNVLIHQSLQAIDRHNRLWFDSGEDWHLQQAQVLRDYVAGLKTWIHREEAKWTNQ